MRIIEVINKVVKSGEHFCHNEHLWQKKTY